jgi:hypothetical protein
MLFEVKAEDNNRVMEALKKFDDEAKDEYIKGIAKAKAILKTMGQELPLPEEWMMLYWEQDNRVYVRFPFPTPMIIKIYRRHKKLQKTLEKFLSGLGIKAKVQYKNDKEELEICNSVRG